MADSSVLNSSREAAEESLDKVVADFRELISTFDDLVESGNVSVERLKELRDDASEKIAAAKNIAADIAGQAKHGAQRVVRQAATASNDYVHENPWSTASIAGGVGLLLGLLVARR